jgi:DhnA family fructose-bisphosphate aldolase class Ia
MKDVVVVIYFGSNCDREDIVENTKVFKSFRDAQMWVLEETKLFYTNPDDYEIKVYDVN